MVDPGCFTDINMRKIAITFIFKKWNKKTGANYETDFDYGEEFNPNENLWNMWKKNIDQLEQPEAETEKRQNGFQNATFEIAAQFLGWPEMKH